MSLHGSLYLSHICVLTIDPRLQDCLTNSFKLLIQCNIHIYQHFGALPEFSLTFWAYKLDALFTVFYLEVWQSLLFSTLSQMFLLLFVLPRKFRFNSFRSTISGSADLAAHCWKTWKSNTNITRIDYKTWRSCIQTIFKHVQAMSKVVSVKDTDI